MLFFVYSSNGGATVAGQEEAELYKGGGEDQAA